MTKYKYIVSTWLALMPMLPSFSQSVSPHEQMQVWEIRYGLHSQSLTADSSKEDEMKISFLEAILAAGEEDDRMVCYVADHQLRVEENSFVGRITITNSQDSVAYVLDSSVKEAYRKPIDRPEIETQMVGDSIIVINPDDFKMVLSDTMKIIADLPCKRAIFTNPELPGSEIIVWYTEKVRPFYWGKYSYLKQLPGAALAISTQQQHLMIGVQAKSIRRVSVNSDIFYPPKGYKIIEIPL